MLENKPRGDNLRTKYIYLCKKHNFRPLTVTIALVLIFVLFSIIVVGGISTASVFKSRTIDFGLKNIGELATQVAYYTNVQVISSSREVFGVTVPFTQSNYIYSYNGSLKVGFNFESIEIDTNGTSKRITINLPEPIVISNDIDENSLEVYDESRNIFTPLKLNQVNDSQSMMKEEALQTAINNGIYESAQANAEALIKSFLAGSFDLQEYSIVFE